MDKILKIQSAIKIKNANSNEKLKEKKIKHLELMHRFRLMYDQTPRPVYADPQIRFIYVDDEGRTIEFNEDNNNISVSATESSNLSQKSFRHAFVKKDKKVSKYDPTKGLHLRKIVLKPNKNNTKKVENKLKFEDQNDTFEEENDNPLVENKKLGSNEFLKHSSSAPFITQTVPNSRQQEANEDDSNKYKTNIILTMKQIKPSSFNSHLKLRNQSIHNSNQNFESPPKMNSKFYDF